MRCKLSISLLRTEVFRNRRNTLQIAEKPSDTLVEDMLTDHLETVAASGGAKYFEVFSIYWNFFQNKLIHIMTIRVPPVKIFFRNFFDFFEFFFPKLA